MLRAGAQFLAHPPLHTQPCATCAHPLRRVVSRGRVPPESLSRFLSVLPPPLRSRALRTHAPGRDGCTRLTLSNVDPGDAASAVAVACVLPRLHTLELTVKLCCAVSAGDEGSAMRAEARRPAADGRRSDGLAAALADLARVPSLQRLRIEGSPLKVHASLLA